MLDSSSPMRSATTRFSLQVCTNSRYFCRFSKKRKLPRGSRFSGGTCRPRGGAHAAGRGGRDIGLDAVERVDGDALALAQAVHQLAVIDRAAAEGRFRHVGLAAELRNLAQNLVVFHAAERIWDGGGQELDRARCPTTICPTGEWSFGTGWHTPISAIERGRGRDRLAAAPSHPTRFAKGPGARSSLPFEPVDNFILYEAVGIDRDTMNEFRGGPSRFITSGVTTTSWLLRRLNSGDFPALVF